MDVWTVVRTILEKNPRIKAKQLIVEVRKKTDLSRSTIYEHLLSLDLQGKIYREKGLYWLEKPEKASVSLEEQQPYPHVKITIFQGGFQLPSVGCNMFNPTGYPIRVKVEARAILGGRDLGLIMGRFGYYSAGTFINLNPFDGFVNGNFTVPRECVDSTEELTIEVRATIIDEKNREHKRLPVSWTYMREKNAWFYEPRTFTNGT